MKIKATVLIMLMALSIVMPMLILRVSAIDIPPAADNPPYILWETGSVLGSDGISYPMGQAEAANLRYNPEFLKCETESDIHSDTRIIIQGRDTNQQNIEAKVDIPAGTSSRIFVFNDTHTDPPMPVAFAYIDRIFQQNGTESTVVKISTEPYSLDYNAEQTAPERLQVYLGTFHNASGFESGQAYPSYPKGLKYLVATGLHNVPTVANHPAATTQAFPVEPANPELLKVAINWRDSDHDLQIDNGEVGGAQHNGSIWLEGLDENGNKIIKEVTFNIGDKIVYVPHSDVWSTVCKAWGESKEEFYIFTHPLPEIGLFEYFIYIDHLTLHPGAYDILANPQAPGGVGSTTITVALRDLDGNLVHAHGNVTLNFYTSAGKISPSNDINIPLCHVTATTILWADTNARTLKVVVDANVPADDFAGFHRAPSNLRAWIELTFDGINSVLFTGDWPIHQLMCGYNDVTGAEFTMPAPFRQWLPPELGGPQPDGIKLDGPLYEVMIPLKVGCNLISSPVYPMFGPDQYNLGGGIPMEQLFGYTSATDTIEAIWWYDALSSTWLHYIPSVDLRIPQGKYFTDGVGYWIKAEKPCTLELSGVAMENAPFTPKEYPVYHSWNLMGFTSIDPMKTEDYLESLATGPGTYPSGSIASAVGPIWRYDATARTWIRNPDMLWPTEAFWMNYKLGGTADLAP